MIKTFRSNATIQAEQFDGSKEMMKKYNIGVEDKAKLEDTEPEYGDDIHYFLNPDLLLNQEIKICDWIVKDFPRAIVMKDSYIKQAYSEV